MEPTDPTDTNDSTILSESSKITDDLFWVGIGASAGGLEALRGMVRPLPENLNATYIVAQHMAPHHRSLLTEIIGRETSLPVVDVTDNLLPVANTIYITPPNSNVIVKNGTIKLTAPSDQIAAPKPSVDVFFTSLAKDRGRKAIGIILSGTGSDGALGMKAIRTHDGITIAQDEHTAKYPGMPLASQDSGVVDIVLSPEELGSQFKLLLASPRDLDALKPAPITRDAISDLNRLLLRQSGVDFSHYKTATVQRRVERRMAVVAAKNLDDYVSIARNSPEEVNALFKDLLITVTSFFRDAPEFDALKNRISSLVEQKKGADIRVWIPGVATGEEAYTVAMLFAEAYGGLKALTSAKFQIFATDIDADAIDMARRGFYPETSLVEVRDDYINQYFDPSPGGYTVRKLVREKIVFSLHNVAKDPPFMNIDLISCRNLLIYFQTELQSSVFERFHYALNDHGLLFLGKSEAIGASLKLFRPAAPDKHIFLQRPGQKRAALTTTERGHGTAHYRAEITPDSRTFEQLESVSSQLESLIISLGPNSLLLGSDMQILKVYGDINQFVGMSSNKKLETTVMSLLLEPWCQDVRVAVPGVLRHMQVYEGLTRTNPKKGNEHSKIVIYPIEDKVRAEKYALVVFRVWEEADSTVDIESLEAEATDEASSRWRQTINELSQELQIAKNNLQTTVEELETSNEELQAVNEELQSSNEELQSTNEELETSNEELQSTNEELSTVNEELQVNAQQLNTVNQSLRSILDNVISPMLVLDKDMYIVDASMAAEACFGIPQDIVQPHISRCVLPPGFPDVNALSRKALQQGNRISEQITTTEADATLVVSPYFTVTNELQGAIVQYNDNTEFLRDAKNRLQLIYDHVPVLLNLRDASGKIVSANKKFCQAVGREEAEVIGSSVYSQLPAAVATQQKKIDKKVFETCEPDLSRVMNWIENGEPYSYRISRIPFFDHNTNQTMMLAVTEDITQQLNAKLQEEILTTKTEQVIAASRMGTWDTDLDTGESFWSDRMREILGVGASMIASRSGYHDLLHPDDRARVVSEVQRCIKTGDPISVEARIVMDDGRIRWVSSQGKALFDNDRAVRLVGVTADITSVIEQLEEVELKNKRLNLSETFSETGHWTFIANNDESLYWSDEVYRIHGVDKSEFVLNMNSALAFYHPDDIEEVMRVIDEAVTNEAQFRFTARLINANNEVRVVESMGQVERIRNGDQVVFGAFRDVTDFIERESILNAAKDELMRSNHELSRFSYVCSHDMKEPVRLIKSMSELLQDPTVATDSEKSAELLSRIHKNTTRLGVIIDSLLAYSRVDAKIESIDVNLSGVIDEIHENYELVIADKAATISTGDLVSIRGARVHFLQLFQNIIGNALVYADSKPLKIHIEAREQGDSHFITIEDNGKGIAEDKRESVFDVFSRLEVATEKEGSGLGLAICKRIVEQYEGTIVCTQGALGGARFEITLPISQ